MTTPRAVPCKHLRMRPMSIINSTYGDKPSSAAICECSHASTYGNVLLEHYDADRWSALETCRTCPDYLSVRP